MTVVTNPARTAPDQYTDSQTPSSPDDLHLAVIEPEPDPGDSEDGVEHPPEGEGLFENETRSDVVFVAGMNGDTWRFPGHRRALVESGPVLSALLETKSNVIIIDHVERRGFEQFLRWQYCEPTQLNSVSTILSTLDCAFKFLCPPLVERCVKRMDEILTPGDGLQIIQELRFMCTSLPGAPSAPPLQAFQGETAAHLLAQCIGWCDSLAHNALLAIDENADGALMDERFEELSYEDLSVIVRRETLRLSSELVLVDALSRWATAYCKRTKRELTSSNKRAALGGLTYCPRYLLLQGDELTRALGLELLEPTESNLVLARAGKLSAPGSVGVKQERLLRLWAKPRPTQPVELPVHLSMRSEPPTEEEPRPSKLCARRSRRLKAPSFGPKEDEKRKKRGCCASFGEGLLRAFICLFD